MKFVVSFDYSRLRGRIVEKFGTIQTFSKAFGITNPTMSAKLNGKSSFTSDEIVKACELLDIDPSEINAYFFAVAVKGV